MHRASSFSRFPARNHTTGVEQVLSSLENTLQESLQQEKMLKQRLHRVKEHAVRLLTAADSHGADADTTQ